MSLTTYGQINDMFSEEIRIMYPEGTFNDFELEIFNSNIDIDPDNYDLTNPNIVYPLLILFNTVQKNEQKHVQMCNRLIKLHHIKGYLSLGLYFNKKGCFKETESCYKKGYKQFNDLSFLSNLGLLYEGENTKDFCDKALIFYKECVDRDPDSYGIYITNCIIICFGNKDIVGVFYFLRLGLKICNENCLEILRSLLSSLGCCGNIVLYMYVFLSSLDFTNDMINTEKNRLANLLGNDGILQSKNKKMMFEDENGQLYDLFKEHPYHTKMTINDVLNME